MKGTTIGKFLEQVKRQISEQMNELRTTSAEDLMYIKEDLIIPHVRAILLDIRESNIKTKLVDIYNYHTI